MMPGLPEILCLLIGFGVPAVVVYRIYQWARSRSDGGSE